MGASHSIHAKNGQISFEQLGADGDNQSENRDQEARELFFHFGIPSKEISKGQSKAIPFTWIEWTCVAIYRKLHTGFHADVSIDAEQTWAEKELLRLRAGERNCLTLKPTRSFARKFAKNAPVPAWIIRTPGLGMIAVDKRVREKIRTPVLVRFSVALIGDTAPCVLAAGRHTSHCANQIPGTAVETAVQTGLGLRTRKKNAPYQRALDALSGQIFAPKSPPGRATEIAAGRRSRCDRGPGVGIGFEDQRSRDGEF